MKHERLRGPRRRRQRVNDPEGTRRNIIEVATKEFADKGFSGARVDEIAARTKTSKRMIYYYFGGKEGLYIAVLEAVLPQHPQHRGDAGPGTEASRGGAAHARRIHLRLPERPPGLRPSGDEREHPQRHLRGALQGDPAAQRRRHRCAARAAGPRPARRRCSGATSTLSTSTCRSAPCASSTSPTARRSRRSSSGT